MASFNGIYGKVEWNGGQYTKYAHGWSMDVTIEALENTNWDNTDPSWRTYQSGLKSFSGSFECYADDTIMADAVDAIGYLQLTGTTGHVFKGYAYMTGAHPAAPIDGMQTVSVDFQGTFKIYDPLEEYPTTTTTEAPTTTTTVL